MNQITAHDPLDRKKEKTSPGDKPSQTLIFPNSLQDVRCPVTVIHNVESNGLNPVNDTEVNLESKPMVDSPESTMIERSRSRLSSISTSTVNNLSCTTLPVPPNMNIASESHSLGHNEKTSPSPWPKGVTPASNPNRNNLHIVATVTSHSIDDFQNTPSDLNICPLSPQIATSDKSLTTTFSLESPLAPTMPAHSPLSKQVPITDSTKPNVPSPTMTSFTLSQPRRR